MTDILPIAAVLLAILLLWGASRPGCWRHDWSPYLGGKGRWCPRCGRDERLVDGQWREVV